jgi:hypothetical protein
MVNLNTITLEELTQTILSDLGGSVLSGVSSVDTTKCISGETYALIAYCLASTLDACATELEYVESATQYIANFTDVLPSFDLIQPFYNLNLDYLTSHSNYYVAVRAINNHITLRSQYASVDDYLTAEQVQVTPTWAQLCQETGTGISEGNIS